MTLAGSVRTSSALDVERIRQDFPILRQTVHGRPLVYLDNAATSQKPQVVLDALTRYYTEENANVHRGVHMLSELATRKYEAARATVRRFLHAAEDREIVFVRGTTEAINLVACSLGAGVGAGDEILISALEHHSNIVPWQLLCQRTGARLRVAPMTRAGELDLDAYQAMLSDATRLVALAHVSNALGTINPVQEMVALAHRRDIPVLLDGAQGAPHLPVNVQALDCDFYAFSGHKTLGPTGIGVLYGKAARLEAMPPYQGGGDMIRTVTFERTTFNDLPYKFEAGTPNIAGAIGLAAGLDYLQDIGMERIEAYEAELLDYATGALAGVPGLTIIGTARQKAGVLAFVLDGIHAHDIGTILDAEGVAVRAGHHCAMPVMQYYGVPATVRASFAFYNTRAEVDALRSGLGKVLEVFA
ncbi:MAG TPA: cysteine desulfurase [Candidatus Sulfotelmatobacter sp.]|nr:cysteine desulfurase [Candidatus Sulfotelmatobacter sp.]